jgi:FAD/FMN-containing dehydrogenase
MPMTPNPSQIAAALDEIRRIVGPAGSIDDAAQAERFLVDHRRLYRGRAALIVRPASTDQVARVVRACRAAHIGIVPQGGNTGYCGGATPDASGTQLLLSLERMRGVREVDALNHTLTVEAGVVLADVQRIADEHGLYFPLSLGAEGSCLIGGNLATNAGGVAVLRYGNARDLVLGLEVVLPDGAVWGGLRKLRKDNAGYDLKHLFMGAEGTLGIITAAVLKLFPRPRSRATAWLALPAADAAGRVLGRLRATCGDTVTSFEYVPRLALELVCAHIQGARDPLDAVHAHYALVEVASAAADDSVSTGLERALAQALDDGDVLDAAVAQNEDQRRAFWRLRETIPEAQTRAGGSLKHDVSVPVSAVAGLLEDGSIAARAIAPDVRICAYGHVGDGNLHFNFQAPAGQSLDAFVDAHGAAISAALYELVARYGGSVCAEHGVGQLKRESFLRHADPVAVSVMRALKHALDPEGLMNPGKVL